MKTLATSNPRSLTVRAGSIGWALDETIRCFRDWKPNRSAIAFVISGVITIFILRVLQLPGGVLPALPVLLITSVPHSVRLLGIRLLTAAVSTILASLIAETFSEQPWILVAFAGLVGFIAFYLLSRALDLLTFIIVLAIPVLYAWQAANGQDSLDSAWMTFRLVSIGLLVSGVTAILIMGNVNRISFQKLLAGQIRLIPTHGGRPSQTSKDDEGTTWSAAIFESHETNLRKLARELGTGSRYQNLETAADSIRIMLALHDDKLLSRRLLKSHHSNPPQMLDVETEFDQALRSECDLLAEAFENDRIAEPGPDLSAVYNRSLRKIDEILNAGDSDLTIGAREYLANLRQLHLLSYRLMRSIRRCTGPKPVRLPSEIRIPRIDTQLGNTVISALNELFLGQQKYSSLFALKATISMLIAFAASSVYSDWEAAPSLLLLAMLLTTVNQGALNISFIMRSIGLLLAAILALLAFLTVIPNLDDIWVASLFLGVILLPGAVLLSRPSTIAAGLNYSMGVMFIFSTSRTLQISLDPITDRLLCVGVATLIPWLVFLLIRPVFARDRISDHLQDALHEIHDQWLQMSRNRSIVLSDADSLRIVGALSEVTSVAKAMQNELGTTERRWQIDYSISTRINLLFVLGRDLEFRTNQEMDRPLDGEELKILGLIAESIHLICRRVACYEDTEQHSSLGSVRRSVQEIKNSIQALEGSLEPSGDQNGTSDQDRPGYLALLRSVMNQLLQLNQLLTDREEVLDANRPIAIGG